MRSGPASLRWLPPLAYAAAIFTLSHQPALPGPPLFLNDKAVHAIVYAGLGFLTARALTDGRPSNMISRWALAAALVSLYGASDEWHQSFVPGRAVEAADWLADTAGGMAGAFFYVVLARWRKVAF